MLRTVAKIPEIYCRPRFLMQQQQELLKVDRHCFLKPLMHNKYIF